MTLRSLRVGFFLALRYLKRSSLWTSLLVMVIMLLTFLNVVVVRGVLVGLPVGATATYAREYAGDILITALPDQRHIDRSVLVANTLSSLSGFKAYTGRYLTAATVHANFQELPKTGHLADTVTVTAVGVVPEDEDTVTNISGLMAEGRFLTDTDLKGVVMGDQLLEQYAGGGPESGGTPETSGTLENVHPGTKVRITINGITGEYTVVGVLDGKVGENARRIFMHEQQLRSILNRSEDKKDEIAVRLKDGVDNVAWRDAFKNLGMVNYATIQVPGEAQGHFLDEVTQTFSLLGDGVGFVGVVVAAITVFIMIFVIALNRQKEIGILKGIGINRLAIQSSYVFLALFYATVGICLGILLLYFVIAPYIAVHPIDFPFSDGVLVAPLFDTLIRSLVLIVTTLFAGYLPARMIVQKNTINAILGR